MPVQSLPVLPPGYTPRKKTLIGSTYSANTQYSALERREEMDKEMLGHFVGSIDVNTFLDRFLPISFKYSRENAPEADFKGVPSKGGEHAMYNPLVRRFQLCPPHYHRYSLPLVSSSLNR